MSETNINEPSKIETLSSRSEKSVFDAIPSKTSFFAGLAAGVMAFSTMGFVLLLVGGMDMSKLGLNNGGSAWGGKPVAKVDANANANANAPATGIENMPPISADDLVRGDLSKAKVVMVEYSDFECPFCKTFHATLQNVIKSYGTDVAWVYRDFPLSFHQNAQKEAEAAKCVAEQGGNDKFWKFADAIYSRTTSNGTGFALDKLGALAKEIGVDQAKFQSCLDSGKYASKISEEQAGGEAAGIQGTPGTIILNKNGGSDVVSGAQSEATVKAAIDALLK